MSDGARPLTRRALAKLRTRQALLAAGKQLFTERGYEQATVRDIARAAGMSTGAVFANFSDKSDLFGEILANDYEQLADAMRGIADTRGEGAVREVLLAVLQAGYAFHLKQLPLLRAAFSVSWSHTDEEEARTRESLAHIGAIVAGVIGRGVASGELRSDVDVDLLADLALAAYRSNYRLAVYDGLGLDALTQRLDRQLKVILDAVRAN
jgi:AcrR family transcriptional regulator